MAHGFYLEAEYESGYILREDDNDHSPYDPKKNVFHAISHDRPQKAGHGAMVRWSMAGPNDGDQRFDVDWTQILKDYDNPRPIYWREMQSRKQESVETGEVIPGTEITYPLGHHFGFQYNDKDGKNQQEVVNVMYEFAEEGSEEDSG